MSDQSITISGNLTAEPELRFTATGQPVANIRVAVNNRYQVNGDWKERTTFFNVTAWGSMGENVAASTKKGDRVTVTGRLEQRSYETQSGENRTVLDLIATDVAASMKWAIVAIEKVAPAAAKPAEAPASTEAAQLSPV